MQVKGARPKKILLTGGHAGTTALATIEELKKDKQLEWKIYWVGPKYAVEGKKAKTLEFKVFPRFGVVCYQIFSGRLQVKLTRFTIISLFKVPFGFLHAFVLLIWIRPNIILSFGGFASVPIVVAGYILRIPIIIHEQTVVAGLANRLSRFFAKKIAISRQQSAKYFSSEKVVVTGNPVMRAIVKIKPKKKIGKPPTIFITCGSRGAQRINKNVDPLLEKLLKKYIVIHQTGELDYGYYKKRRSALAKKLSKRYFVHDFIDPLTIWQSYHQADIVIARAGANTVSEIITTSRPAILIPIPWARFDEQAKNAQIAEEAGIAIVMDEHDLSPEFLLEKVNLISKNWQKFVEKESLEIISLDEGAATRLAGLAKKYTQ